MAAEHTTMEPLERAALARLKDTSSTALVVVDFQNAFCAPGGAFERIGRDVAPAQLAAERVGAFLPVARASGVLVVIVRSAYDRRFLSPIQLERNERAGYEDGFCDEGSWGAELYAVTAEPEDLIVTKHRYSAFHGTGLAAELGARGIADLLVAGTATNVCVETTVREAYMHDFRVVVLEDCCATYDPALAVAALTNIRRAFGAVSTSSAVSRALADAARTGGCDDG